jgi:RNA polymerase sigma factor (sigma-70 family)
VEEGEDLFQETARSVYERAREGKVRFESIEHARNYFFRALRNLAAEAGRGAVRAKAVDVERAEAIETGDPGPLEEALAAERSLLLARRRQTLADALGMLKPASRDLLRMRYAEGLTFQEVRERTGIPISTLQARVESALRKLRKRIGKEETEP